MAGKRKNRGRTPGAPTKRLSIDLPLDSYQEFAEFAGSDSAPRALIRLLKSAKSPKELTPAAE